MNIYIKIILWIFGIGILMSLGYWYKAGMKNLRYDAVRSRYEPVSSAFKDESARIMDEKYINGSREYITFEAPVREGSNETITRHGVLVKRKGARATLVIVHGFMCDKHDVDFVGLLLGDYIFQSSNGVVSAHDVYRYNTFIIDLRAHGENKDGQCCTFGRDEALDVIAAAQYLKRRKDLQTVPLGVYAFSMGAVASILAQAKTNIFDFGISDCPFDSTTNLIGRGLEHLKITLWGHEFAVPGRSLLHKYAYSPYVQSFLKFILKTVSKMDAGQVSTCIVPVNTVENAKKITVPWLFITCKNDEKAPPEAVTAVYNEAQGFKRLLITDGRRHFDSIFYGPARYQYKVHSFLRKVLNESYKAKVQEKIKIDGSNCLCGAEKK